VRLVHEKSCWVALPPAYVARLLETACQIPLVLQLRSAQGRNASCALHACTSVQCHFLIGIPTTGPPASAQTWHVAWGGGAASSGCLEVPAALARCQGLAEGALVALRALPECPAAVSASVEPANSDDWEQVELNAGYMEEQLLNQAWAPLCHMHPSTCMHACCPLPP
jgi:peroxin-1